MGIKLYDVFAAPDSPGGLTYASGIVTESGVVEAGRIVRVDPTAAPVTVLLPGAPTLDDRVGVLLVAAGVVTVSNAETGSLRDPQRDGVWPTLTLTQSNQYVELVWDGSVWRPVSYVSRPAPSRTGNIYLEPPLAPHAFDDEFSSGSADLAERGWIIRTGTTALLTRAGEVLLGVGGFESTQPAGVSPVTYRSSIIDGKLLLQLPDLADVFIYKAVSGAPAIYAVRGRMCLPRANQIISACVVRDNPAGENFAGNSNRHAWTGYHHTGSAQTLRTNLGGEVYGNAQVTVNADCTADLHVLRLVGSPPAMGVRGLHIDSMQRMPQYVQRCYDNSYTLNAFAYAGIRLIASYSGNNNNPTDTAGGLFVIDYVREMSASLVPWFGEY